MRSDIDTYMFDLYMLDLKELFPGQVTISGQALSGLRGKSIQTIYREKANGTGVEFKETNGNVEYPLRHVAMWLASTNKTA